MSLQLPNHLPEPPPDNSRAKSRRTKPQPSIAPSSSAFNAAVATTRHEPQAATSSLFAQDDFFGHQPTPTAQLPAPQMLLENLTRCVIEVMAGARDIDQLARWVTDQAYRHVLRRAVLAARARTQRGEQAVRPVFVVGRPRIFAPRDSVLEAVVLVHYRTGRVRAVALRLEGLDGRWRASAIHVM